MIFLVITFLSGCESMPFSMGEMFASDSDVPQASNPGEVVGIASDQALSTEMSEFVTSADDGEIAQIAVSPWSTNHAIMALEKYTSATGRKCRTLQLIHSIQGLPNKQFVCEDDNGEWVPIRCISR